MKHCLVYNKIPNQRLYFKNDDRLGEKGRTEDDIIGMVISSIN